MPEPIQAAPERDWSQYKDVSPIAQTTHAPGEQGLASKLSEGAFMTAVHAVGAPAEAAWQAGPGVARDIAANFQGEFPTVPGESFLRDATAARQSLANKATVARMQGHTTEAAFHDVASKLPFVGPAAESIIQDIHNGYTNGDPETAAKGWGGLLSFFMPGALKGAGEASGVSADLAEGLRNSAANNYFKTFNLPNTAEGAANVPMAERTAQQLARGPAPIAMTRSGLKDTMAAGQAATGPMIDQALGSSNMTADAQDLVKTLARYGREKYATPNANGVPIVHNEAGMAQLQDLVGRIQDHSTPVQTTGVLAPGATPPTSTSDVITHQAINKLRQNLESGTLDNKGRWKDVIDPKSLEKLDRDHAGVLKDYLSQNNPDISQINKTYSMFAKGKQFLQDAYNRSKVGNSLPMPGFNAGSGQLAIPKLLQQSMAAVPWNTVAGATKAGMADALASGNWGKAQHIAQFARLGVPYSEDNQ